MKSFKGAMSKFYGEQRAQVKAIKERSLVNKARNEMKKEQEDAEQDQPLHYLRLDGRSATLVRNDAQFYTQQQQKEGLVPWAAHPDILIDRYDVRSLLDMYVEPDARVHAQRQRSAKEIELEEMVHFETYRDLIRLKCLRLSERQGIKHAEQENVAIRAHARTAAVAALETKQDKGAKPLPSQFAAFAALAPAGTGQFAAVGFSYGGGGGGAEGDDAEGLGEEPEDEEDESDDEDVPATAEDQDMDLTAWKEFAVEDFSSMLRWAMREEAEEAEANRRRNRRGWSRKKARLRAKRLAGQGLDPSLYFKPPPPQQQQGTDISWIPERKPEDLAQRYVSERGSPVYEGAGGRGRSRSPGARRDRPQTQYITSFGSGGGEAAAAAAASQSAAAAAVAAAGGGTQYGRQQRQEVMDAVPGAADPALEGPAVLPAAAYKLHGVRPDDGHRRDRYGSVSGRDYSKAKAAAPATVIRAVDKSKETPQERLKRLMAAQLNKKIQKDSLTAAQKQQQVEAERRARVANEIAAQEAERRDMRGQEQEQEQSRSPDEGYRRRSRSRSGERLQRRSSSDHYRRRSRSRSRDRDRQYRSSSR